MSSTLQMTELYDNALLGILQHVGNIQNFLQVYFGFLYRKTDFYRLLSSPNDRMGFPHGVSEKMVLKAFRLFDQVASRDRERTAQEAELKARERAARTAPPPVQEVVVESEQEVESLIEKKEESADATPPLEVQIPPLSTEPVGNDVTPSPEGDQATPCPETAATECGQAQFQANPDSYNGAVRDNYSWSQDYTDVEVRVFVPANVIKGKQVSVNLQPGRLRVAVREGAEERLLVDGELSHRINTETSLWSLEPGKCVLLSLTKCGEVWWNAVLKGEKEIDVNQINRERSMASVDEEEHAVLDRLTFDYRQKLQGQPQSHEMKAHEMLKKGWDAEGSPFKGQKFDASMFDIPASAVQL